MRAWDSGDPNSTADDGWVLWLKWKVLQQQQTDSFSGNPAETLTYTYSTPTWHYSNDPILPDINSCSNCPTRHWNDYRGSEIVTVTDTGGVKTEYRFQRGMNGDRLGVSGGSFSANITLSDGTTRPDDNWLVGQIIETQVIKSDNTPLSRIVNWVSGLLTAGSGINGAYFVSLTATEQTRYGTIAGTSRVEYQYDSYGNVTREVQKGDIALTTDDRTIERSYLANPTAYIVNRLRFEKLWSGTAPGTAGAEKSFTEYGYDNQPIGTAPTKGNQTLIRRYRQTGATPIYHNTTIGYDTPGRPTTVTDAGNHTTTTYDTFYGTVQSVTNHLGHVTVTGYDPGWGVITSLTDPNNRVTTAQYDSYGRLKKVWLPTEPTGGLPSLEYNYAPAARPANIQTRQLSQNSAYLENWTYVDGFGRTLQSQRATLTSGQRVVSSRQYDNRGNLAYSSTPYQTAGAAGSGYVPVTWGNLAGYHHYTYDELGNRRRDEMWNLTSQQWAEESRIDGRQQQVTDANGHRTDFEQDGLGRLSKVTETNSGGNATTTYAYDSLDNLTRITDAANNLTTISYNLLGWKTAITDPDMGNWSYEYDNVGNLTGQTNGRGLKLVLQYDALNRLIAKRQTSTSGSLIAEYSYDGTGQKGLLSTAKAYSSEGVIETRNLTYDARNRLILQEWVVPGTGGGTFRLGWGYNAADRLTQIQYPANNTGGPGETITRIHDPLGQLDQVISQNDNTHYVASTLYNPDGQAWRQRYDQNTNGADRRFSYQPGSGRLQSITGGAGDNTTNRQNLTYAYDTAGNITSQLDVINSSQKQCYQYDWRNRLTRAFSGNSGCTAYSATGSGAYDQSYTYSAIGNLTGYAGSTYTYGSSKPHAVTGAYGNSYSYDGNGNQTGRTIGGASYTLTYDYENRLTEIKQGATSLGRFIYSADGSRVKGTVGGVATVYLGGLYEYQSGGSTSYYPGHNGAAALRRSGYAGGNGIYYLLTDQQGSTVTVLNQNGSVQTAPYYYPYGGKRAGSLSALTAKRYTGQYHESTLPGGEGLYYYNARWYDPKLGRFLSADSLVPGYENPQNLNRYSYALGNPVRFTDPTGHYVFEENPDDSYVWSIDKELPKLVRASSPDSLMNWDETQEGDFLLPLKMMGFVASLAADPVSTLLFATASLLDADTVYPSDVAIGIVLFAGNFSSTSDDLFAFSRGGNKFANVALGVNDQAQLFGFARQTNSHWYGEWQQVGLTDGRVSSSNFGPSFEQAMNRAGQINFNLDGIRGDPVKFAQLGGTGDFGEVPFTARELYLIQQNPEWLAKTTFYQNGQVVFSLFK